LRQIPSSPNRAKRTDQRFQLLQNSGDNFKFEFNQMPEKKIFFRKINRIQNLYISFTIPPGEF